MTTRFDIAPEDLAQIAMREVASGLGILSLFGPAFGRAFSAPFDRNIAAATAPWYLAGGAPAPVAVWQPKGAADLAASYVNLINPGTYNAAPGVAPTLGVSGWGFNGTTQYLVTAENIPISGAMARTVVGYMRLDVQPSAYVAAGVPSIGANIATRNFSLLISSSNALYGWVSGTDLNSSLTLSTGVFYPIAFQYDGTNMRIRLGASTQSNTPTLNTLETSMRIPRDASDRKGKVTVSAAAIYSVALTDSQWSAISAAVAAL